VTTVPMSLALCFDAPMQSWGIRSRGVIRDTTAEPTKSGVVGLLASALGVPREDDDTIAELAALQLAVRVDREGILERDYHTTQNVPTTQGTGHRTVVSERYYLADALFLVVLEGEPALLQRLNDAVNNPQWPLFFGRRAFVPARPLVTTVGLSERSASDVIDDHHWLEPSPRIRASELGKNDRIDLRAVLDCPPTTDKAEVRHDHPLSFTEGNRRYSTRTVLTRPVPLTDTMITAAGDDNPCT
jgi:CRISPR system Cascade subunit CasD